MPISQTQLAQFLSETDYFESISADDTATLAALFEVRDLAVGETIFTEGSDGDAWYLILSGAVAITKSIPDAPAHQLASLEEYEGFGEMSLLDSAPRMATAVTTAATTLACMSRQTFQGLVEANSPAAFRLMQQMSSILCQRLRETTWVLQNIIRTPRESARKNANAVEMVIRVVATQH